MTVLTPDEQSDVDHEIDVSNELFDDMLDTSIDADCDPVWVAYSLFLSLVHFLTMAGFTVKQLQADVADHTENSTDRVH